MQCNQEHYYGETLIQHQKQEENQRWEEKEKIPEDIVSWISNLINLLKTCEYSELRDDLIRDRISCGWITPWSWSCKNATPQEININIG